MGLVNAVYSWPSVKALYFTVLTMNLTGLLALALAILWAVRFERGFGDYLNLVTPGDGHVWTAVIVSAVVCCSPAYILGVKCWLCLKLEPARSDLEAERQVDDSLDPHDVNRLLFFHVVACLLSGFLVAVLNATYLILLSGFQQKSRDGLMEAIEKYGTDITAKARVDGVQAELECCGDNSYEDWFRVPWLKLSVEGPEDVENGPRLEEQSVVEEQEDEVSAPVDVPFSCCSNNIPKPCVHHDILSPSAVYNYNPKYLTIATRGCRSRIIERGEVIRTFLAGYLALLSVYQMMLSVMSRLLQTAYSNELYIGPEKSRYRVWVFFKPRDFCVNEKRSEQLHPQRKRSRRKLSRLFSKSLDSEEISTQRGKNRKSNIKVLTKIRSKISAKSRSLPVIRPTFFSNNSRAKNRSAGRIEENDDDEEETPEEEKGLLSNYVTRSEVVAKKDRLSVFSLLPSNSSATNFPPPPPPPPPFVATLDMENEGDQFLKDVVPSEPFRVEANVDRLFNSNIIANQNSGRRIKVLEKFGNLLERNNKGTQRRESGGADYSRSNLTFNYSEKRIRSKLSSTDVYDRFRGTLQHTLARREAVRSRREWRNVCTSGMRKNLDDKGGNILARIRCNDVPPSYRLLADFEQHNRRVSQTCPISSVPPLPSSLPPPPSPPLPPPLPPTPRNSARIRGTKTLPREPRQCSICNRPVRPSSSSSSESLVKTREDTRTLCTSTRRKSRARTVFSRNKDCSRDYVSWDRSTPVSKSVQPR